MSNLKKNKNEISVSDFETNIISRKSQKAWKTFGIIIALLLTIFLVSCIIDIYNFFYNLHPHAGYTSLALVIALILIFIIRPIVVALSTPCFTLDIVDRNNLKHLNKKNYKKLKKVANNIIKYNNNVSEESKKLIKQSIHNHRKLNETLKTIYDKEITKDINKLINVKATEVLITTAISQNNKFDALTMIIINIRLIMQIVVRCGYHPSYAQLAKLIYKVFRNAFIAYTIQSLQLEDLVVSGINKLVKGTLSAIPTLNEITKGIVQGSANSLLTLRVGILTRKYLYEEYNIQNYLNNKDELNKTIIEDTLNESNENIDSIISEYKKKKKINTAVKTPS